MSKFSFMGWGLFALELAHTREELLPFAGRIVDEDKYRLRHSICTRFKRYVL